MVVKDIDPEHLNAHTISQVTALYFLRNNDECDLQVKATVVRVLFFTKKLNEDLSHYLKELQPKLQLTEEPSTTTGLQRNRSTCPSLKSAQKIGVIHLAWMKSKVTRIGSHSRRLVSLQLDGS